MKTNTEYAQMHEAFLNQDNEYFYFGCRNPFCGHGNPALPNRARVRKEAQGYSVSLVSHQGKRCVFNLTLKLSVGEFKIGDVIPFEVDDNLPAFEEALQKSLEPLQKAWKERAIV